MRVFSTLLNEGVDVLDILPALQELSVEEMPFYDCRDPHPANGTVVNAARLLADVLESYGVKRKQSAAERTLVRFTVPPHRTLFPKNSSYEALVVEGGTHTYPAEPGILVVGDSFPNAPKQYGLNHANLSDHLSWELGRRNNWIAAFGGSYQVFQNLRRNPDFLRHAKVVIFAFHPNFLVHGKQYKKEGASPYDYETGKL